ncbi:Aste57867_18989 [Aphanomyces stellatus]|uniref:Aste57867_18989 protein n=1 Tax=Aphanomyces stellatus TaxID=120398 RepID=A0A485LBQ1_9STRA|nr:hypothetical protein As57867_018925 [Aphanomyces stellatus]VFT95715.1 Aste57867_18989 [Aphanomyces stellatus]
MKFATTTTTPLAKWRWAFIDKQVYPDGFHKSAMQKTLNDIKNDVIQRLAKEPFDVISKEHGFHRRKSERMGNTSHCIKLNDCIRLVVAEAHDDVGPIMVAYVFHSNHTTTEPGYGKASEDAAAGHYKVQRL